MADIVEKEISETPVKKVDPVFLITIASTIRTLQKEHPNSEICEIVYLTVKEFLKEHRLSNDTESYLNLLFVYYVESYKLLKLTELNQDDNFSYDKSEKNKLFYDQATLSLFDLYIKRSEEVLVRKLLIKAVETIREIIIVTQSEKAATKSLISDLSNIALITETIKDYIRGTRRYKNFSYIIWLQIFLTKIITQNNLSALTEDKLLSKIIPQIVNRHKVILL